MRKDRIFSKFENHIFSRTVYFTSKDRIFFAKRPHIFSLWAVCLQSVLYILLVTLFHQHFSNLIKNSASLCYQHAAKTSTQTTSYEVQFGCEKRNFASQISNQRELTGLCCSTSDFARILKYFGQT